ncbi:MAG: hypothetical protein ACRDYW_07525 [Acidimicrobiales bacterium]
MRRRLGRLVLGFAAAAVFLGVAGVGESRAGGVGVLGVLVVTGVVWAAWGFVQRRRPAVPGGWTPSEAFSFRPAAERPAPRPGGVPLALSRVEVRELTTSPAFGVGLGFCALALFLFGRVWAGDYGGEMPAVFEFLPILGHPLAGMVVLASFRARTRGRRDGTEELFESCPASPATRTAGHLLTSWAPAVVALVFGAALAGLVAVETATAYGPVGARQVAALVGTAVLAVGATFLGIALARWIPWTLVPVVAVIAIGFVASGLATSGVRTTEPKRLLSTFIVDPEIDIRLTAPHWFAHHLWIVGLAAIVAVLAVLRDRRGPAVLGAGLLAVTLAVGSAVAATRPIDTADARRIAAIIADPARLPCTDVVGLDVCTFAADDDLRTDLADTARPVAAMAPPGALEGWSIHQIADSRWQNLDPEVVALLGGVPEPDPHVIPIEFTGHPLALEGLRVWTALAATGALDTRPRGDITLGIRGQARGTIALWLATRGADREVQLDLTSLGSADRAARDTIRPWPDSCYAGSPPVQWADTDVLAARSMLALDENEVRRVIHSDWARFTDRATTTDELMAALGLEPVGIEGQTSGGSAC